jgi:hypothetical protein
VTAVPFWYTW